MKIMRMKLSLQLIFVIVILFFIIGSIAALFDIKSQTSQWLNREYFYAENIADTILRSIENTMLAGKRKELDNTLKNLSKTQHLSEVKILSAKSNNILDKKAELIYQEKEPFYRFTTAILNKEKCYSCHNPRTQTIGFLQILIPWKPVMNDIKNNTKRHIFITILMLVVLSFVVIIFIQIVVDRPIKKLLLAFNDVSKGDFSVSVNIKRNNEFDVLSTRFNQMVKKLKEFNEEIEKYHQEQIAHADRLSSLGELLASLSHEIKNPLASIKSTLQVLQEGTDNKMHKEILGKVNDQVIRLTRTIQNVLSYARMPQLNMVSSDITEIIEKAFFLVDKQISDQRISVKKNFSATLPKIVMDPEYILQVLVNMLLNAIQSMAESGELTVKTSLKDDFVLITISDTGKGISKENLDKIFKPFFTTKSKGTGLGLSICQRIIKMHNGEISVNSIESKGTEFIIKLPIDVDR